MTDIGDLADKTTLEQWAVDLLKSELKLSNYMLSPMCQRTQYAAGSGNWDLSGKKTSSAANQKQKFFIITMILALSFQIHFKAEILYHYNDFSPFLSDSFKSRNSLSLQ